MQVDTGDLVVVDIVEAVSTVEQQIAVGALVGFRADDLVDKVLGVLHDRGLLDDHEVDVVALAAETAGEFVVGGAVKEFDAGAGALSERKLAETYPLPLP